MNIIYSMIPVVLFTLFINVLTCDNHSVYKYGKGPSSTFSEYLEHKESCLCHYCDTSDIRKHIGTYVFVDVPSFSCLIKNIYSGTYVISTKPITNPSQKHSFKIVNGILKKKEMINADI